MGKNTPMTPRLCMKRNHEDNAGYPIRRLVCSPERPLTHSAGAPDWVIVKHEMAWYLYHLLPPLPDCRSQFNANLAPTPRRKKIPTIDGSIPSLFCSKEGRQAQSLLRTLHTAPPSRKGGRSFSQRCKSHIESTPKQPRWRCIRLGIIPHPRRRTNGSSNPEPTRTRLSNKNRRR